MDYKNPLKLIDPLTGMEMTMQPPMPANQMGAAKPMFNQTTQNVAQQVYGGLDQRQMSMGAQAPVFMSAKQAENLPPELVAEIKKKEVKEGSDDSSPLEFHKGVSHDRTVLGQQYSLSAENYADSVRVAKREKRFNEMMKPKMTKTITSMPYTKEQLEARSEKMYMKKSEAQELPRIKRK
jgi:hypothetical protein